MRLMSLTRVVHRVTQDGTVSREDPKEKLETLAPWYGALHSQTPFAKGLPQPQRPWKWSSGLWGTRGRERPVCAGEGRPPDREQKQLSPGRASFLQTVCPLDISGKCLSGQRLVETGLTHVSGVPPSSPPPWVCAPFPVASDTTCQS